LQFLGLLKWQLTVRELSMAPSSIHKLFRLYGILSSRFGTCVIIIFMALFNGIKTLMQYNIKYKLSFITCRLIHCSNMLHHQSLWIKFFVGLHSWSIIGLLLLLLRLIPTSQLLKHKPAFIHRTFYISWSENHLSFSHFSFFVNFFLPSALNSVSLLGCTMSALSW